MNSDEQINKALDIAMSYGGIDGSHHKMWVIDQMVRALTNCPMVEAENTDVDGKLFTFETMGESEEYLEWITACKDGEDGSNTYDWDTGIAP